MVIMVCSASAASDKGILGVPEPLDEFDDRILPIALFRLTVILCLMTAVLELYRVLCALKIYQLAVQEKSFWRKLRDDSKQRNKMYNVQLGVTKSTTDAKAGKRADLKMAEMDLKQMNWLERFLDLVVNKVRGKTTTESTTAGTTTGKQTSCSIGTDNSNQVTSIMDSKAESDRRVVHYLMSLRPLEHECSFCSVKRDIDQKSFTSNEIICPLVNMAGTILCLCALLYNYKQRIFYLLTFVYFINSLYFILTDSLGKAHLYKVITRSDMCGFRKVVKTNESVVLMLNLALFFTFMTTFGFYCIRDEYINSLITEIMVNSH